MRHPRQFLFLCALILLFGQMGICQVTGLKTAEPADTAATGFNFSSYFHSLYRSASDSFDFNKKSAAGVSAWHNAFLPLLQKTLGLDKIKKRLPGYVPKAELKQTITRDDIVIQKWFLWVEPEIPLPLVVLRPKKIKAKIPLVIVTHGHAKDSILYEGIYPRIIKNVSDSLETIPMQAVKQGYLVVAPTMRAFGSTRTDDDKRQGNAYSCHTQLMRDLLVGRTVIGDRVWDMTKVLDWMLINFPVDPDRIAITGQSGGGTVSLFTAACDDRIKVAVPSSSFCTVTGSIGSISHCDCNYIPGLLDLGEMSDIAGLVAPRYLRFLHGVKDRIFPIEETRKAFSQLQKIYAASGHSERAELYEGPAGHQYYSEGAWPFIKKAFHELNQVTCGYPLAFTGQFCF